MRNDSILNTGRTSASIDKARRAKEAREKRMLEKQAKKAVLAPGYELAQLEIQKELDRTQKELLALVGPATPEEDVKSLLVSLNLYAESMRRLKRHFATIMRTNEPEVVDGESFDD